MQMLFRAACLAFLVLAPGVALAQAQTAVALADPDPPGWDASGQLSWLAVNKGDLAVEWNRWYDVATVGASVGRFLGPHLKVEFDAATSASAQVYVQRRAIVPTQPYPIYVSQPQRFRMSTFSAGASHQFFDNRWFHPVVGGGVEAALETRTIDPLVYVPPAAVPLTLDPPGTTSTWRLRPFADVGFKWYVAERAFIRSDVRTTFERGGVGQVSWRTGFGFDF